MDPVVGTAECEFTFVCNLLHESNSWSALLPKLFDIALLLKVSASDVERIRLGVNLGRTTHFEALHNILTCWRSKFADDARVSLLCSALEKCGIAAVASKLRTQYALQHIPAPTTFISCPDGFNEFLESEYKIFVICCKDNNLTKLKLQDTTNCVHLPDCVEFANLLCNDTPPNQIYSVTHSEQDGSSLTNVLQVTGSKLKSRGVIITDVKYDNAKAECSEWDYVTVSSDTLSWEQLTSQCRTIILGKDVKISGKIIPLKEVITKVGLPLDEIFDEETLITLLQAVEKQPNLVDCHIPEFSMDIWPGWLKFRWTRNFWGVFKNCNNVEIKYSEEDFLRLVERRSNGTRSVVIGYSSKMRNAPLLPSLARTLISKGEVVLYAASCEMKESVKRKMEVEMESLEEAVINCLSEVGGMGSKLTRVYLKHLLKTDYVSTSTEALPSNINRVNVMLDKFEDMDEDIDFALTVLKTMTSYGLRVKVWLTTNPALAGEVEKCLNATGTGYYIRERNFLNATTTDLDLFYLQVDTAGVPIPAIPIMIPKFRSDQFWNQ